MKLTTQKWSTDPENCCEMESCFIACQWLMCHYECTHVEDAHCFKLLKQNYGTSVVQKVMKKAQSADAHLRFNSVLNRDAKGVKFHVKFTKENQVFIFLSLDLCSGIQNKVFCSTAH